MLKRAWATMTVKDATSEGGKRRFTGIASSIATDRQDDIVVPKGAVFKLPMPLLWQHDSDQPIGWVRVARVSEKQIEVDCELHNEAEPGRLKDRLDEAWQSIKALLVAGLSIGFNPIKYARIDGTYGLEFQSWEWLELSAVTIPANQDAAITTVKQIKSIDKEVMRAASGHSTQRRGDDRNRPGASGNQSAADRGTQQTTRSNTTMNLAELRAKRAEAHARLTELNELRKSENRASTDDEAEERQQLMDEIRGLDDQIADLEMVQLNARTARPIGDNNTSVQRASESRGRARTDTRVAKDADDKFAGQSFIRKMLAQAAAFQGFKTGRPISAAEFAEKRWGKTHPGIAAVLRANEVPGGGTGSGEWGAELVGIDNRYNGDFVNFLYAATVFDRLGLRPAPKNVSVKGQDGAATGYWVGESKGIPVSKPDFSTTDLTILKAAGICIASKELLADSDPAAEQLIRDSLVEAISQRIDTTFLSLTAASAGVSPAGIFNGVAALHVVGNDEAAVRSLVKALYSQFITDKNSSNLKLVMNPGMAKAVGLIVNALGQTSFPGLGAQGGTLLGDPVVTGDNVDPSVIALVKPSDIWLLDEGIEVSMSDSAMIEQNSAPTGATDTPVAASQTMVSMFQEDSVAIKVVRRCSYKKRRANAVAYVDDADFDGTAS